jgi:hypothetical protein
MIGYIANNTTTYELPAERLLAGMLKVIPCTELMVTDWPVFALVAVHCHVRDDAGAHEDTLGKNEREYVISR